MSLTLHSTIYKCARPCGSYSGALLYSGGSGAGPYRGGGRKWFFRVGESPKMYTTISVVKVIIYIKRVKLT